MGRRLARRYPDVRGTWSEVALAAAARGDAAPTGLHPGAGRGWSCVSKGGTVGAMAGAMWGSRARAVVLAAAAGAVVATASETARANCARPSTYDVTVAGNTVTICPVNRESRGCPDLDGMLRVGGMEAVRIADRCSGDAGPDSCYVDECVPKGSYQYGFAKPYECCQYCCGTDFYATASVEEDPPPECLAADAGAGGDAEDADAGGLGGAPGSAVSAPWSTSSLICTYAGGGLSGLGGSGGASGTGGGGSGGAMGGVAGNIAGAGGSSAGSSDGCTCAVAGSGTVTELVIGMNGVLVLLGLLLGRRRRAA